MLGEGEIRGEVLVEGFKILRYRVGHMKLRRCEYCWCRGPRNEILDGV